MRETILPRDRLSLTLRYLATGNPFRDLSYFTGIASNIVRSTLVAILKVLETRVMNTLSTAEEWTLVGHTFETIFIQIII